MEEKTISKETLEKVKSLPRIDYYAFIELINQKQVKSPCQNIMIGAWILSQNINKYGFSWTSIQKYNGYDTNLKYSKKIYQTITKLYPQLNTNLSINKTNSKFLYVN